MSCRSMAQQWGPCCCWRHRRRAAPETLWMAAARGACRNGDHEAERRYRNTARLIRRRPPLTARARCLVRSS